MRRYVAMLAFALLLVATIIVSTWSEAVPLSPPDTVPTIAVPAPINAVAATAVPPETARVAVLSATATVSPPVIDTSITVVVVDSETDRRVADATIDVVSMRALTAAMENAHTSVHTPIARRIRDRIAHRATTNANGEAQIGVPAGSLMIEARHGTRWGFTVQNARPENGHVTIRIGVDRQLRVQVVDASGRSRIAVPVALRRQMPSRSHQRYTFQVTETEAPDGIATFEHFQRRLRQGAGWHATFAFPLRDGPAVPVSLATPATPARQLVLPATGSLRVTVCDADGKVPQLEGVEVHLVALANSTPVWPDGPWAKLRLDHDVGVAMAPWLGLGLSLVVSAQRGETILARAEVFGPRSVGEVVECELRIENLFATRLVTGRLVRNDGTPWPACKVSARCLLNPMQIGASGGQRLEVDATGRFELAVAHMRPASGSLRYRLNGSHPDGSGQVTAYFTIEQEVPPEGFDLGDVRLDHGPLLVSGTVLDLDNRPVAGVRVRLRARTIVRDTEHWPTMRTSGTWRTGEHGRFFLFLAHGEADPITRLRVTARCDGYVAASHQHVVRGHTNVIVRLSRAGAIAGSFALSSGLTREDLLVVLQRDSATVGDGERARIYPVNPARDATFQISELPAGNYTMRVRRRGANNLPEQDPVVEIEGLRILPGVTCRDPRIQGIPIATLCQSLRIEIVDRRSTPLPNASVTVVGLSGARAAQADPNGVCRVRTGALPVDLEVTAFGCRPRLLRGVHLDRRVVLEDGIAIALRSGAQPAGRDPHYQLGVHLIDIVDGRTRGQTYGAAYPWNKRYFDDFGKLALRLPRPGDYECRVFVYVDSGGVGRSGRIVMPQPPRITVIETTETQTFDLHIPQELVDEAVQRASR